MALGKVDKCALSLYSFQVPCDFEIFPKELMGEEKKRAHISTFLEDRNMPNSFLA